MANLPRREWLFAGSLWLHVEASWKSAVIWNIFQRSFLKGKTFYVIGEAKTLVHKTHRELQLFTILILCFLNITLYWKALSNLELVKLLISLRTVSNILDPLNWVGLDKRNPVHWWWHYFCRKTNQLQWELLKMPSELRCLFRTSSGGGEVDDPEECGQVSSL